MNTRIAVITGGSRGLGRATALKLADRGIDVLLTYRSAEVEAREVVDAVRAKGRRAAAFRLDVGDTRAHDAFVGALKQQLEQWGVKTLDYIVSNAGIANGSAFADTTEAQLDELFTTNFKGPFFLIQKLLPVIADGGRIVTMSTGLTRYTFPGQAAYAASKAAVEVMTRYLAAELGPRRITVNVVAPGGIVTEVGGGIMLDPGTQQYVAAHTAFGRVGQPDDVAGVVASLLSADNGWVTGQRIEVTGGFAL